MDAIEHVIPEESVPVPTLEPIAMVALDAGRMGMEAGASAKGIEAIVAKFARGLGADRVDLRIGYASLAITIGIGPVGITRMRKVGALGVNQRVDQALWLLAERVSRGELSTAQVRAELDQIAATTPRHSAWVMAVAVGLACAAFGRLLKTDWLGTGPVFVAAAIGQYVRRDLLERHVNVYICATIVSFLSAMISGFGAQYCGSETIATAMIASILLLVPGIPAFNSQNDIMEGHPTLGSARTVTVAVTLIFVAVGLWFADAFTNAADQGTGHFWPTLFGSFVLHQTLFGAIAAAGFGVLFNLGFASLPLCAVSGALALAVRTFCMEGLHWNLETASFAAAVAVGAAAQVLPERMDITRNMLGVVGCIPMVPGSFAAKAIIGLFALSTDNSTLSAEGLDVNIIAQYTLRVLFTIGAIGTGLAIPTLLLRVRVSR